MVLSDIVAQTPLDKDNQGMVGMVAGHGMYVGQPAEFCNAAHQERRMVDHRQQP